LLTFQTRAQQQAARAGSVKSILVAALPTRKKSHDEERDGGGSAMFFLNDANSLAQKFKKFAL
jgi:hypothetical protein